MCELGPVLFPKFDWALTGKCASYSTNDGTSFLDFPVPKTYGVAHHQTSLGFLLHLRNKLSIPQTVLDREVHTGSARASEEANPEEGRPIGRDGGNWTVHRQPRPPPPRPLLLLYPGNRHQS
ncbi:hypothetical protein Bca52824_082284 [Brassica carinata]|uniref:Uncharacterized protein n=1 Tax=Brassica carinata TaxID=52824 RepID=A0A8X7PJL6_BRACI|nr:hypothetical protein Bca52824_082284 [Brassica carinata]